MIRLILLGVGAILSWCFWEVTGELAIHAIVRLCRPILRPMWRVFVEARCGWPLLTIIPLGAVSLVRGYALLGLNDGRADAGLAMFFGGAGAALLALILWKETRAEAGEYRRLSRSERSSRRDRTV